MAAETQKRFSDAVSWLTRGATNNFKVGLAVSGGPDSLALLLLANAAYSGRIAAATVDHGLRLEAAGEARFVGELCAKLKIPHSILTLDTPITGNIQSAARKARYALLGKWADAQNCEFIATAHHADDQLETVLMRVSRGSGIDGMSGVRPTNGRIIRPLLGFTKNKLINICDEAGIIPVQDPSNADTAFDRVRMRKWLASTPHPFDAIAASRSVSAMAEASQALEWTARHFAETRITAAEGGYTITPDNLPRELQRRLLLIALNKLEPTVTPRGDAVERILDALIAGNKVTMGNILCSGKKTWHFSSAPPRRTVQKP